MRRGTKLIMLAAAIVVTKVAAQGATVPRDFHGEWATTLAQCGTSHPSIIHVHADRIDYAASRGTVQSIRSNGPLDIELELEFVDDRQTARQTRQLILSSDFEGLREVQLPSRQAIARVRC